MNGGIGVVESCGTCRANQGVVKAPGGVIYDDGLWRLEHVLEPIPMVGWLVLKPLRHVETMSALTHEEAAAFGLLAQRTVKAIEAVLSPTKVYVCLFAEAENFAHIHFHFIPRFADTPTNRRGPRAFEYLREAADQGQNLGDVGRAVSVAAAIREELSRQGVGS